MPFPMPNPVVAVVRTYAVVVASMVVGFVVELVEHSLPPTYFAYWIADFLACPLKQIEAYPLCAPWIHQFHMSPLLAFPVLLHMSLFLGFLRLLLNCQLYFCLALPE